MKKFLLVFIVLAIVLVMVLTGCSNNNDNEDASNSNSDKAKKESTEKSAETTKEKSVDLSGKYDPPIEITTVKYHAPTVKFPDGDDYDNNVWTREYLEKWGIKVTNKMVLDDDTWVTKNNLMITTGDLADFFIADPIQFKQLLEADLIQDLTESYEKYTPELVKKVLTEGGDTALKAATVDGKLMAIPVTNNAKEVVQTMWIRTDWLGNLGLAEPKTMQDVLMISEAFTKQDPDGNSKDDTFGIAADSTMNTLKGFFHAYHGYMDIWMKDASGNLAFSTIQPEMKNALLQLQLMFKDGQIDKEFGVKAEEKVNESLASGKIGIYFAPSHAGGFPLQAVRDNNPKAGWKAFPIMSIDGSPALVQSETAIGQFLVVRKGYEHPEAILKLLDTWLEKFYFNTDEDELKFVNTKEGNSLWLLCEAMIYRSLRNVDIHNHINEVLDGKKTEAQLTPAERGVLANIRKFESGDESFWGIDRVFGRGGARGVVQYYLDNNLFMENELYATPTPTMTEKDSSLKKMKEETFIKIINGSLSIDEFDRYVENWNKAGGEVITKEMNDWYKSVN